MPNIFNANIAKQIYREFRKHTFKVTLEKITGGTRSSSNPTSRTQSTTTYTGRGFVDDYETKHIDGTIVLQGDRKVIIFGASLPSSVVPKPGDRTTIESETKTIVNVIRDPAGATYECQVR